MEDNQPEQPVTGAPPSAAPSPSPAPLSSEGSQSGASSPNDMSSHKALAIVGYIIPILFFIPLITEAKHNAFAKFHANQQLNLLIVWVVSQVIVIIPILGWVAAPLLMLAGMVFMIMGVINAAGGTMKPLPLIGQWKLLK